jgi:predicted nucleotide-binding protein
VVDLPPTIAQYHWLDLSGVDDVAGLRVNATRLAEAVVSTLPKFKNTPPLTERLTAQFADFVAASLRRIAEPPSPTDRQQVSSSAFVVHGHDLHARDLICRHLVHLGVEPVVLARARGSSQFLLQKFFEVSNRASFAVVIVSADDIGAPLSQYDSPGVADRALQFRARQNVILELGFFYGRLGWENVFVLQKPAPRVFPNFESPSDLDGAVFEEIDDDGTWKDELAQRLARAGLTVEQPSIKVPASDA